MVHKVLHIFRNVPTVRENDLIIQIRVTMSVQYFDISISISFCTFRIVACEYSGKDAFRIFFPTETQKFFCMEHWSSDEKFYNNRLEKSKCAKKQENNCGLSTIAINARFSKPRGKRHCNCRRGCADSNCEEQRVAIKCGEINRTAPIIDHHLN